MSIKVILVDDHIIVREGIRKLLEYDGNFDVVAEAGTGKEFFDKLENIKTQVVILDINLPDINGFQILDEIKRRNLVLKVIILTGDDNLNNISNALEKGAIGFLSKKCDGLELKKAIIKVLNNEIYIQHSLNKLMNKKTTIKINDKSKIDSLTKRELEVLIQIANGLFNKEIAIFLNISERTVKNHVSNIFKKIGVSDRTQAAVFAIRNNVIDLYN